MTPTIARDFRRYGKTYEVATLVRVGDEAKAFFAVTSDEGVRHRLDTLDRLGLLIRPQRGEKRMTVNWKASKLEKQERWYAFEGWPGDVLEALRLERERRREAGEERDAPVPEKGALLRSERTGRPVIIRW